MEQEQAKPQVGMWHLAATVLSTVVVNAIILAYGYGILVQRVEIVVDDVRVMKSATITPEAARRLSVLEAQFFQLRQDSTERWAEVNRKLDILLTDMRTRERERDR